MARIPTARILERLEALYAQKEIEAAERHLLYWLAEAKQEQDLSGEYQMHNELMGHYRKNGIIVSLPFVTSALPARGQSEPGASVTRAPSASFRCTPDGMRSILERRYSRDGNSMRPPLSSSDWMKSVSSAEAAQQTAHITDARTILIKVPSFPL